VARFHSQIPALAASWASRRRRSLSTSASSVRRFSAMTRAWRTFWYAAVESWLASVNSIRATASNRARGMAGTSRKAAATASSSAPISRA